MKTIKIKHLLLSICCLLSTAAMAQTRISGTVNAPDGPVMMCNVVEIDANNRNVSYYRPTSMVTSPWKSSTRRTS